MTQKWLGFWVLRRAYRILVDDSRPMAEKLTREAKRILVIALATLVILVGLIVAGVIVLVAVLT